MFAEDITALTQLNIKMKEGWKIHCGNCLNLLPRYKDSVHMIITSPPYNVGFDYGEHIDSMPLRSFPLH